MIRNEALKKDEGRMKRLVILLVLLTGCGSVTTKPVVVKREVPTVNLPVALRQKNWVDSSGSGSCVHASFIVLARWHRYYKLADSWRQAYAGGEWPEDIEDKFNNARVRFSSTRGHDNIAFLEWALRTRRGAAVFVEGGLHCVNLVYLDDNVAGILDNNDTDTIKYVSRKAFEAEWTASGSYAFVLIYTPPPPMPVWRT